MVTLASDYSPRDSFAIGTTTVTYTATDASGNTATCSFNVTVVGEYKVTSEKNTPVLERTFLISLLDHSILRDMLGHFFFVCAIYNAKSQLVSQITAASVVRHV